MNVVTLRTWLLHVGIFGIAFTIYWLSAGLLERTDSPDTAYFNYLADAFLAGRLYLLDPPAYDDLTFFADKWYVAFPPLPALLLLPWVAIAGVEQVNTVLFGALMGAMNVVLAFLLVQTLAKRGWTRLGLIDNLWLTVLFGVGTVHWYVSTLGSVWFISQVCTVTFMLLAAWSTAATGSAVFSGTALALAMLARPHVGLCYPLLLALAVQHRREQTGKTGVAQWASWAFLSLAPLVLCVALMLWYNHARFNNPFDFGYLQQNIKDELLADLRMYGQFDLHYVPHNLWVMLLAGPAWDAAEYRMIPTIDGMSIFHTTPALVYVFNAVHRSIVVLGAWVAWGLLLIPLLTYYNTGWWQFGYRFSLDFMTPALVLLAFSAGSRVGWRMQLLILIGVLMNAWGVWWYFNPRFF
ncbi:MAG: hypothetical protein M3R24_07080 [Chloroflexota bacterium]|nr:hypothetical protein [Chloroflexota bacterium]PLS77530.1 MAG: hypothetical protein CYG59_23340 [Chloroflexota bacterium]